MPISTLPQSQSKATLVQLKFQRNAMNRFWDDTDSESRQWWFQYTIIYNLAPPPVTHISGHRCSMQVYQRHYRNLDTRKWSFTTRYCLHQHLPHEYYYPWREYWEILDTYISILAMGWLPGKLQLCCIQLILPIGRLCQQMVIHSCRMQKWAKNSGDLIDLYRKTLHNLPVLTYTVLVLCSSQY